ncbi:hypothetical protein COU15_01460 [Candidatus Kaiserbacteria bacterium CG10_big_fil_rev_8_21_14_0_10_45_20]|uniref:HAD family hydrolase n=1 Tax=Candidatus Kaiserbacteria bacterium CG10_big_fil_rev_8_21_14_0_10_45_20 TaxID=1974607 RepID=A0A2H0UFY5_9BACT|nr:MAG: hypothetical protein COU15_01460 [Candidatus Kaiserbacteria bacterium CG10_big_fil_rev_8_21_14_0_10_45_20]
MTFFLDFDRTLFDTFRSYQYLSQKLATVAPDFKPFFDEVMLGPEKFNYNNPQRGDVSRHLETLFLEKKLILEKDEYAPFVYPDAQRFLKKYGAQSVVVTANRSCPSYQKAKLHASGVFDQVREVRNIPLNAGNTKGAEIARALAEYPAPYVYVDDHDTQLDAVQRECPTIVVYEMRRDGKPASSGRTAIQSFDEVEVIL